MRQLRFPKDIYAGEHIDAALKVFARFGTLEQDQSDDAWIVKITAATRAKERRLAGELGNYALGLTIRQRGER